MNTRTRRPVYLSLFRFHFPITAVLSISHRISGVVLFVALAPLLWLFERSIGDADGYRWAVDAFEGWLGSLLLTVLFAGAVLHLLAGVRYLLMDVDIGVSWPAARRSAGLVIALTLLLVTLFVLAVLW